MFKPKIQNQQALNISKFNHKWTNSKQTQSPNDFQFKIKTWKMIQSPSQVEKKKFSKFHRWSKLIRITVEVN